MSTETKNTQTLIDRLFSAGAHFGFSKSRRHPTVKPYLFGNKQGTDIFDLEKVATLIDNAKAAIEEAGRNNKKVIFVATKEEMAPLVKKTAEAAEMPYMTHRWIGGALTNFGEIKKRLDRLQTLTTEGENGELERRYTKKERVVIGREMAKLNNNFGGIKNLDRTPHMMVVVDPRHDAVAVAEANEIGIPVIGIMSSDNNTSHVTHPIIVNDALQTSVTLVLEELTAALKKGQAEYVPAPQPARTTRTARPVRRTNEARR